MRRVRACFIVNPAAGRGKGKTAWTNIAPIAADRGAAVRFTERPGHAVNLARTAAESGFDRIVAVGGDGTISEVANGLVGTEVTLAAVPSGTGNDLCRSLHIPLRASEAALLALEGAARPMDIGEVQGARYFVNVAGAGFDAEVARATNALPKYLGGTVPYVLGILRTLWRFGPVPMEIDVDGRRYDRKVLLLAIGIAESYGGGMRIVPGARIDDGLFEVCIGGDLTRAEILSLVPKIYTGGHLGHPKVEFVRGQRVSIRASRPVAVHADGDLVGDLPMDFINHPRALRVVTGESPLPSA